MSLEGHQNQILSGLRKKKIDIHFNIFAFLKIPTSCRVEVKKKFHNRTFRK